MTNTIPRGTIVILACALIVGACGNSGGKAGGGNNSTQQDREPLTLETSRLGVGLRHGETGYLGEMETDRRQAAIETTTNTFDQAFLHLQSYDEEAPQFGAWTIFPTPRSQPGAVEFSDNPEKARLAPRTEDLMQEVKGAMGEDGFEQYGLVIDVWRVDGSWYVRWDGEFDRIDDNPREQYGFFLDDMYSDLLEQITQVAKDHQPAYIVVGTDMQRLLARRGSDEGLSPAEFSNFKRFFRDVVSEVNRVSPDTMVGAGFNWDRFARQVAPAYGETDPGEAPEDDALLEAFETILLPFAEVGGVLALESRRGKDADASYYDVLATYDETFELEDTPVLWYSIGSPVTITSYRDQRVYLQKFLQWNAGVDVESVAWNSLINIDGAGGASGQIREQSRCANLVEDFGMAESRCYDGLYETNLSPKETMTYIEEQAQSEESANSGSPDAGSP